MIRHDSRPLCYLAGPFSSNPVANTRNAIVIADRIQATGLLTVHVPHLNILWDFICPHDDQYWLDYDYAILVRSNVLLRIPGDSPGADDEVPYAMERDIPVFYTEMELLYWAGTK